VRRESGGLLRTPAARYGGLLVAVAVLLVAVLASLLLGSRTLPIGDTLNALLHGDRGSTTGLIVWGLRWPRTLIGIFVGSALGASGALMQGVTRNPLADPGILGVNAGAAFAVVLAIYVFGITTLSIYVGFAFVGAAVASVVVYALGAMGRDGASPVKLALAGTAVSALLVALTSAILLVDLATLDRYRFWVVGSLAGRDLGVLWQVLPFLGAGLLVGFASARSLNVLGLGDDVAKALGAKVGTARLVSALAVVLLTGSAVAAAGPIGFVGLTIPHVARALVGTDYRWIHGVLRAPRADVAPGSRHDRPAGGPARRGAGRGGDGGDWRAVLHRPDPTPATGRAVRARPPAGATPHGGTA